MKHFKIALISTLFIGFQAKSQSIIEDTTHIHVEDPIMVLTKSEDSIINFSSIDLNLYNSDQGFDFNRYVDESILQQALNSIDSTYYPFTGVNILVDNVNYFFCGESTLIPLGNFHLVKDNDTLKNLTKVFVLEKYYLHDDSQDTIAQYTNNYYCFTKSDGTIDFEVFEKTRVMKSGLTETFVGIGLNDFEQGTSSINLALNPNPATTSNVNINFTLPSYGEVSITISNQIGTVNDLVFSSQLSNGFQSIPVNITNYTGGNYEISVYYNNQIYSQTLIKQ